MVGARTNCHGNRINSAFIQPIISITKSRNQCGKWDISPVVQGLQQARHEWRERQNRIKEIGGRELPSKEILKSILEDLCGILFPMRLG